MMTGAARGKTGRCMNVRRYNTLRMYRRYMYVWYECRWWLVGAMTGFASGRRKRMRWRWVCTFPFGIFSLCLLVSPSKRRTDGGQRGRVSRLSLDNVVCMYVRLRTSSICNVGRCKVGR
ncbi:hypothetical protein F5X99DRAFT_380367 [Biscogniauxia marginata]|nr:hypothetical protein F5X99DRAFT_380367 [Biscogniauxia marginata]